MTKEEIEELIGLAAGMGLYDDKNPGKRAVILGKAIKELQQGPCKDTISRQETLKYFEGWKNQVKYYHPYAKNFDIPYEEAIQRIKDVPPVNPQEPKTGYWIDDEFGSRCSCCNIYTHLDKFDRPMKFRHCSMCGAKMQEVKK